MCDCVDLLFCLVMGKNVIIIVYIRWLVDFFEIRSNVFNKMKVFFILCIKNWIILIVK